MAIKTVVEVQRVALKIIAEPVVALFPSQTLFPLCGFAQSQKAYDTAVNELFDTMDTIEDHLSCWRYLCGDELTHANVCLFTTLTQFDLVYNVLFRCTKKKLLEYPNLHAYMHEIGVFLQNPEVAETCNFTAIMEGY
ncbi:uncharacterized protein [Pyrus communis]|uniref:uncharacterized protein n=1 Tax=Pyrus communis TaxID=23211 RepID=UPI0035C0D19E